MPKSKSTKVTLVPGDGIGTEVIGAATRVLDAAGANIEWEIVNPRPKLASDHGSPLSKHILSTIMKNRVALKGPLTTPVADGLPSLNVELRKKLNLFANIRPVKNLPGIKSRYSNVDLIVIRENTEDLYAGIEHTVAPGVTQSLKVITKEASQKVARFAFEYARKKNRGKITAVHKANILKLTDGLFLKTCRKVAVEYSDIEFDEIIVDNLAMQLVLRPEQFDILLLTNLYGDIISDLCAGLVGGLGIVPGANLGDKYAVFESIHGSAPDISGQNRANPLAAILSSIMMLRYLHMEDLADRIQRAVHSVTGARLSLTPDLGGKASTSDMTQAIIGQL